MSKKTLYAFIVSFVLLLTVIVLNRNTLARMKDFTAAVDHTREVITLLESLSKNFKSAQIYTPTYDADSLRNFYELYRREADSIGPQLSRLQILVQEDATQRRRVDSLSGMIGRQMPVLMQQNIVELLRNGEGSRLDTLFAINNMISRGVNRETRLLNERKTELNDSAHLNNLLSKAFSVIAVALFLFTFLNIFFISKKRNWLEGFLESILNTSPNGILHCKAIRENGDITDFRISFANKSVQLLFNTGDIRLVGKRLTHSPLEENRTLFQQFTRVMENSSPLKFEIRRKERWLIVSAARLRDGVTASFQDITELKSFESELKNKISDLEQSNAELEQYAYIASHDLQEPLRKIRSFSSYLQDTEKGRLSEKGSLTLDKIINAAARMSSLIKDVLSYSGVKKEAGYEKVDLNITLHNVLMDLDLLITQKHAEICAGNLPSINAIPLQMTQLLYNLVSNAVKFSKENQPPKIKIISRQVPANELPPGLEHGKVFYEIVVSDDGVGFLPEYSNQIFGLFKRLHNKQHYQGSGIGLAMCKKVVENHHGLIVAKGNEGAGASFYVYLPESQG